MQFAILCSGVALGVYIPALITNQKISSNQVKPSIYVLENLIIEEKRNKITDNKTAFHRNFKIALIGQKIAQDLSSVFDKTVVDSLFKEWSQLDIQTVYIYSGFWLPVAERYKEQINNGLKIILCHMDSVISASWKIYSNEIKRYRNIRIFNHSSKSVDYLYSIDSDDKQSCTSRKKRLVIHGGGWGMGTYQSKIPILEANKIELDIINYEWDDYLLRIPGNRYFMIDPHWKAWQKYNSEYIMPPFGEIQPDKKIIFSSSKDYPDVYDLIKESSAIVSKPGGATLLDSFSSETPIVFLEPFGDYEAKNAELWQNLGFGIAFTDWQKSGFDFAILDQLRYNLSRYKKEKELSDYFEVLKNAAAD